MNSVWIIIAVIFNLFTVIILLSRESKKYYPQEFGLFKVRFILCIYLHVILLAIYG